MGRRPLAMVAAILGLLSLWSSPSRAAAAPAVGTAQYLCLIVLDAGRPDYITQNLDVMPTMRAFLKHARWYDRAWVGDLLSITPPSHAVIGTGSLPKDDGGIVNWNWAVRNHQGLSPTLQSLENFQNGYAFRLLASSHTPTLAGEIKRKYPGSTVIAGSGSHFFAAGMMGGPDASWIYSYVRQNGYWAPFTLGPHKVPTALLRDPTLRERLPSSNGSTLPLVYSPLPLGQQGELTVRFAIRALQRYRPRGIMINLTGPDTVGHWSLRWRPEERIIYKAFDRSLAELLNAYKRAGIYKKTLFVITSDHGMMRSAHRVLDRSQLDGLLQRLHVRVLGANDTGGTMKPLWLKDPSQAALTARAVYASHFDNVSAVFYLTHQAGQYRYKLAGCEQCSPRLIRAYQYLLGTEAGPTAEDVAILLRENARMSGLAPPKMLGRHSGADWGSQHITLMLSGPGIHTGVSHQPARLADIAPTVERLMGIQPRARDGIVLADALQHPLPAESQRQSTLDRVLSPDVQAIMDRARSDTQEEAEGLIPNHIPPDDITANYEHATSDGIAQQHPLPLLLLLSSSIPAMLAWRRRRRQRLRTSAALRYAST